MRVKQLWISLPILPQIKLVWDRITATRLTLIYFIFSLLHCVIQLAFQSEVFVLNDHAEAHMHYMLDQADAGTTHEAFPVVGDGVRLCESDRNQSSCTVVWDGSPQTNLLVPNNGSASPPFTFTTSTSGIRTSVGGSPATQTSASRASTNRPTSTAGQTTSSPAPSGSAAPTPATGDTNLAVGAEESESDSDSESDEGEESDSESDDEDELPAKRSIYKRQGETVIFKIEIPDVGPAEISESCAASLNYPVFELQRTEREDGVFIAFHIWVLLMSIVAILNESIPHTIASFVTHIMSTGWAGFQLLHTQNFHREYHRVITDGACTGLGSFLGEYWEHRKQIEIPSLVLNVLALIASGYLSYKLLNNFGWKTFKRVGASRRLRPLRP